MEAVQLMVSMMMQTYTILKRKFIPFQKKLVNIIPCVINPTCIYVMLISVYVSAHYHENAYVLAVLWNLNIGSHNTMLYKLLLGPTVYSFIRCFFVWKSKKSILPLLTN